MSKDLKFCRLVLISALVLGTPAPSGLSQDEVPQDQEQSKKQEKPKKKKGGFFSGLKAISGSSLEQQEVTATAGSKTVGEGEEIGNTEPDAADRKAVTDMENYAIPSDDLSRFQEQGRLKGTQ